MYLAACVQVRSDTRVDGNLERAEGLIRRAAGYGARLVVTPENLPFLGPLEEKARGAQSMEGPVVGRFRGLAAELGIYLHLGSFAEVAPPGDSGRPRCYNTAVLVGPGGEVLSAYRKLHLFDVEVPDGLTLQESAHVAPGCERVVTRTELGRIGHSICYDLRFPELYRALVDEGAEVILVPSAFTLMTGKEHWHALLRARAIETQCYVLAPAQWGQHDPEGFRRSYGHSLVVDPWGTVIADAGEGERICLAEIDLSRVEKARRAIPVAHHRRLGPPPRLIEE